MTAAPQFPCKRPGCGGFTVAGGRYCQAHQTHAKTEQAATRAVLDQKRGSAHERGYTSKWSAYARAFRARFPLSPGYLVRTPYWTHNLAQQFHALRMAAVEAGQFSVIFAESDHLSVQRSALSVELFAGSGARFLEQFPIYTFHASPRAEPAAAVDHIIPVSGPGDPLFWAEWNHQALSKSQHDTKTAQFDGGFRGAKAPSPAATEDGGFRGATRPSHSAPEAFLA